MTAYIATCLLLSLLIWRTWRAYTAWIIKRKGYRWWYRNKYLLMPSWRFSRKVKFFWSGYKCKRCKSRTRLDVHHKTYQHLWWEWLFPWELEVLCRQHHVEAENKKRG